MVGVVILPEKILGKLKSNIQPQWKIAFFSAIIVGLIAHLYKITNWLPNWDSLVFRYDAQNMVSMGRWFLPVVSAPSSFYDLPWLTGLMAIVLHALGAVLIVKMLDVKKGITAVLVGGVIASFPTTASVMMYNYVADAYAFSFLLACLAAYLLTKNKPNYILAVAFIALSVGIYQAYITVTIMLLLCFLIKKSLSSEEKVKSIFGCSFKFLLTGAIGMAVYYLALTVILKLTNTTLLDYQGFGDAAALSGINIFGSLYQIKESFLTYFFDFSNGINAFNLINLVIFAVTIVLYLSNVIKNRLGVIKTLLVIAFVLFLPIGASVLAFVNSSIDYHNLMKMGFVAFYLLFIIQYEKADFKSVKLNSLKLWTVLLLSVLLIFNHIVIANVAYHKLNLSYEKSIGTLNRIADRIEQTNGAETCDSILVIGALEGSEAYSANISLDMTGTTDSFIIRADDEIVGQSVFCAALNDYCGKDYSFISGEKKTKLLERADVSSMASWPKSSSILVVDNVIVIKLGE